MAEAGGGPISVIARHMQLIRDDFISELFDKMKAEIRGLDYDARMADLWRASITENFVTAVHYLDRDTPQSLVEAPAAALAYARAAAQRDIPLSGLVGLKPSRGRLPLEPEYRRLPVGIVANGVLTRTVRDTAAFYREAERLWRNHQLPPVGDVTSPVKQRLRIAVVTRSVLREASPEVRQLTLKLAGLLEELGHRVEHVDHPPAPASFVDDFVLYWGFLALAQVRSGRRTFGRTFDPTRLDELTLGLARHTGRNLHRLPLAIMRLRMLRRRSVRFFGTYDVLLTPTVAEATPQVGYLAPTDYQTVLDRLSSWVVFTPVQNVTGVPAISLPLAQSADGMPVGMMLSADTGREALLLELAYELEEARPWARIHAPNIAE
ncbi:amidase [Mycobacterium tuberculosis]|nr:amidase [Mycobacterium tuberculosis]